MLNLRPIHTPRESFDGIDLQPAAQEPSAPKPSHSQKPSGHAAKEPSPPKPSHLRRPSGQVTKDPSPPRPSHLRRPSGQVTKDPSPPRPSHLQKPSGQDSLSKQGDKLEAMRKRCIKLAQRLREGGNLQLPAKRGGCFCCPGSRTNGSAEEIRKVPYERADF